MISLLLLSLLTGRLFPAPCVIVIHGSTVISSSCPSPLVVKPVLLPPATVAKPYSADLSTSVSGGVKPYTFTATSDLDGLIITPDGRLTGIPAKAGSFNLTWSVSDAAGVVTYVQ